MSIFGTASGPRTRVTARPLQQGKTSASLRRHASAPSVLHCPSRAADVLDVPRGTPPHTMDVRALTPFQECVRALQNEKRYLPNRLARLAAAPTHAIVMLADGVLRLGEPRPSHVRLRIFADMGAVTDGWFACWRSKRLVQALQENGFLSSLRAIRSLPTIKAVADLAPAGDGVNAKRVVAILSEIKRMDVEAKLKSLRARQARLLPADPEYVARYARCIRDIVALTTFAAELARASADQSL